MTDSPTEVVIDEHFDASVPDVWRAWTDPSVVRLWWGSDPDGVVTSAALDVRSGGAFEVSFRDADGTEHTSSGEYRRVDPTSALEFTWRWRSEPGVQSLVRVEFREDAGGTAMRFVHGELFGVSEHDYAQGWRRSFGKLRRALASHD